MYICSKYNIKCPLADKNGQCIYNGFCKKVIDKCEGCARITKNGYCEVYVNPEEKWRNGNCPMATHLVEREKSKKKKVNPIKQSKRKGK